jgi:hypothetical protein
VAGAGSKLQAIGHNYGFMRVADTRRSSMNGKIEEELCALPVQRHLASHLIGAIGV